MSSCTLLSFNVVNSGITVQMSLDLCVSEHQLVLNRCYSREKSCQHTSSCQQVLNYKSSGKV